MATDPILALLDSSAVDGSPAAAFASHRVRADRLTRYFASTKPLTRGFKTNDDGSVLGGIANAHIEPEQASEDSILEIIAHLHTAREDPGFTVPPGSEPSRTAAIKELRRLNRGNGQVGTPGVTTKHDYDMALKEIVVLLYRYADMLSADDIVWVLNNLVPEGFDGGHTAAIEIAEESFLNIDIPETENHLLMIESSRYLLNQYRRKTAPGDQRYDNTQLGLWLIDYMQRAARFDFLEFNARPYSRLACTALFNLYDFAEDKLVKTGAQILLDYVMMKMAVSSNRARRISPFRRQQHRIYHHYNQLNDLFNSDGDPAGGFFLAFVGPTDGQGKPARFPAGQALVGVIAALSSYRPPVAAYELALGRAVPPYGHRFYQSIRPQLPASGGDVPEAGLELYYSSPSFLISAGGSFLNSGYGHDEISIGSKDAWEQTSRAQAATLIPTRAEVSFHDLLRCEPYPDRFIDPYFLGNDDKDMMHARSVNNGVHQGLLCGANMRPWNRRTFYKDRTLDGLAVAGHRPAGWNNDILLIGWRGEGSHNVNIGRVMTSDYLDFESVEALWFITTLPEESDYPPAIASHANRVFVAWTGTDDKINLIYSLDDGQTFTGKFRLADESPAGPALVSHNGQLFVAWTGTGDGQLNIASIAFNGDAIAGIAHKTTLGDSSELAPSITSHQGNLYLGWTGTGEGKLNLVFSEDNGVSFKGKFTFGDSTEKAPTITSTGANGALFYGWTGTGEGRLNVARVIVAPGGIKGFEAKTTLADKSDALPGLGAANGMVYLGFRGEPANELADIFGKLDLPPSAMPGLMPYDGIFPVVMVSADGTFNPFGWRFSNRPDLGFFVAAYRQPCTAAPGSGVPYNYGIAYAIEDTAMDIATFQRLTLERNVGLPAQFTYGNRYDLVTADDKHFHFWVSQEDHKYTPRVFLDGEPNPVDDFTKLPLVDGPYLKSVRNGHDGAFEIRWPGCMDHPLVLDFSATGHPVRADNILDCPQPWLDRVSALKAMSLKLLAAGFAKAAQDAADDAAKLTQELTALGVTVPTDQPPNVSLATLAAIGIDYSVDQSDILDWLGDAVYTPYPALGAALLRLLDPQPLAKPVYIDVIRGFYEDVLKAPSPRTPDDVRMDTLKAAVLMGSNERYTESVTAFERLLRP